MQEGDRTAAATGLSAGRSPVRARISLRQILWGLVLALAVPAVLVAAGGLYSSYQAERRLTDLRVQETVRALTSSLEREIEKTQTALQILALSPSLRSGDLAAFYRQAKEASPTRPFWVALFDPDGRPLLNTRVPYGTPLPDSTRMDALRRVQETRRAELSNLYTGPETGQFLISLDVPVVLDGRVAYILSVAIGPEVFQGVIADQRIAEGWNAAIVDRSGRIVARSRAPERFVGQRGSSYVLDAIAASPEGALQSVTLDGVPVRTYFSQSRPYGWTFVMSIPAKELAASFQRPLFWLLTLAAVMLVGVLLAMVLSRSIAKPVDRLVAAAQSLGRGEPVGHATTHVLEFDTIRNALSEASADIRKHGLEREEAYAQLAESEARLRLALMAGDLGSWEYTPSTGAFTASPACRADFGRRADAPFSYADLIASIHPEDRPVQAKAVADAIARRTDLHVEHRVIWPDLSEHWILVNGRVRIGPDGHPSLVGVTQDVTERRLAENRQAILLHELNHRVKNTLATVQSVAAVTRRSAEQGDPDAWAAFTGRLQGLAKTHDLLTATSWSGALLEDVLRIELDPYQDVMRQRVRLRGPRINLQPSAVLALGLAVHELATNATKYGSLSVADGRVNVMWAVTTGSNPPVLLVEWTEIGGPPVRPPERQGFGTKLIQRGLAQQLGGEIKLEFAPSGVRCVVSFPITITILNQDDPGEERERFAS